MAKVYVSYSREDSRFVEEIRTSLRALGHQIVGEPELMPGQTWRAQLDVSMRESDAVVVILSMHSLNSSYVMTEVLSARTYAAATDKLILIPVLIERIPIPDVVRDIQVLDASDMSPVEIAESIGESIDAFLVRRAAKEEEEKQTNDRIEENASIYIDESITDLSRREARFRKIATWWYGIGYVALTSGIIAAIVFTQDSANLVRTSLNAWPLLVYYSVRGLVVIGLVVAISKYSFNLGKSFMNEALRNSDRQHAISFGKFYLRSFGSRATWAELKEVFQHWNIDTTSSFAKLDAGDFDPRFVEHIAAAVRLIANKDDKK